MNRRRFLGALFAAPILVKAAMSETVAAAVDRPFHSSRPAMHGGPGLYFNLKVDHIDTAALLDESSLVKSYVDDVSRQLIEHSTRDLERAFINAFSSA